MRAGDRLGYVYFIYLLAGGILYVSLLTYQWGAYDFNQQDACMRDAMPCRSVHSLAMHPVTSTTFWALVDRAPKS
jgi:hypothetical protein